MTGYTIKNLKVSVCYFVVVVVVIIVVVVVVVVVKYS